MTATANATVSAETIEIVTGCVIARVGDTPRATVKANTNEGMIGISDRMIAPEAGTQGMEWGLTDHLEEGEEGMDRRGVEG